MDCFYHPGIAAVGTCKSCGKGICHACAADLGQGLACRERCEADVTALINLVQRGIRNAPKNDKIVNLQYQTRYTTSFFYTLIGALFLGFAIFHYVSSGHQSPDVLSGGLGLLFLGYGLILFRRIRMLSSIRTTVATTRNAP